MVKQGFPIHEPLSFAKTITIFVTNAHPSCILYNTAYITQIRRSLNPLQSQQRPHHYAGAEAQERQWKLFVTTGSSSGKIIIVSHHRPCAECLSQVLEVFQFFYT